MCRECFVIFPRYLQVESVCLPKQNSICRKTAVGILSVGTNGMSSASVSVGCKYRIRNW